VVTIVGVATDDSLDGSEPLDLVAAAEALGVHYQTAYRWVRDGSLPAVRVRGRYRVERQALAEFARRRDAPEPVTERVAAVRWDRIRPRFERHLLEGGETAARTQIVDLHGRGVTVTEMITHLLVPSLRSIGEGWVAGTVSIAEEHRATAVVERLLGEVSPRPRGRRRGTAVVAAVSGERHALPTTMAAIALREDRWHVEHLGGDLPPDEVVRFVQHELPDLVVLSVTAPEPTGLAEQTAHRVEQVGVPVIVGGPRRTLDELLALARAHAPAARKRLLQVPLDPGTGKVEA
jgi:MerR family transcriptional regulator, light-induced transcriptional regulator